MKLFTLATTLLIHTTLAAAFALPVSLEELAHESQNLVERASGRRGGSGSSSDGNSTENTADMLSPGRVVVAVAVGAGMVNLWV
jgi:hypothetical protein